MSVQSSTITIRSRQDFPALASLESKAREALHLAYATRYKPVVPPALATRAFADSLELPDIELGCANEVAVVFLPRDFEPHLAHIAGNLPQLCVQSDVGRLRQAAYLSFEVPPAEQGQLPLALWLELEMLMNLHEETVPYGGDRGVPIVLVAGPSVVVTWFAPNAEQLQRCRDALSAAARAPGAVAQGVMVKALQKAQQYGERPWLFMRYEMPVGQRRYAVNWAPFAGAVPSHLLK